MLIILSYMKGDNVAGRFADLMVTTRGIDMMSFASFEEKLKKTFQPAALVRNAETALFALKQGKELVEDYFTWLYQLAEEAKFSVTYHSHTIVNLIRRAVKSEILEFVKRNQPDLIDSTEPQVWETALVRAEEILNQIAECKRSVYAIGPTYNPWFISRTQTKTSFPPPNGPPLSSSNTPSIPHPNPPSLTQTSLVYSPVVARPWNWEKHKWLAYAKFVRNRGHARIIPLAPAVRSVA